MTMRKLDTHDRKVRTVACSLKKQGYLVRADGVRGYLRPIAIGQERRVPDIVATKDGKTRIIEVKTPQSIRSYKEQLTAFARYAAQRENTTFEIVVTIPRKSKITS